MHQLALQTSATSATLLTMTEEEEEEEQRLMLLPVTITNPVQTYTEYYHAWTQRQADLSSGTSSSSTSSENERQWATYYAEESSRAAHYFHHHPRAHTAPFALPPPPSTSIPSHLSRRQLPATRNTSSRSVSSHSSSSSSSSNRSRSRSSSVIITVGDVTRRIERNDLERHCEVFDNPDPTLVKKLIQNKIETAMALAASNTVVAAAAPPTTKTTTKKSTSQQQQQQQPLPVLHLPDDRNHNTSMKRNEKTKVENERTVLGNVSNRQSKALVKKSGNHNKDVHKIGKKKGGTKIETLATKAMIMVENKPMSTQTAINTTNKFNRTNTNNNRNNNHPPIHAFSSSKLPPVEVTVRVITKLDNAQHAESIRLALAQQSSTKFPDKLKQALLMNQQVTLELNDRQEFQVVIIHHRNTIQNHKENNRNNNIGRSTRCVVPYHNYTNLRKMLQKNTVPGFVPWLQGRRGWMMSTTIRTSRFIHYHRLLHDTYTKTIRTLQKQLQDYDPTGTLKKRLDFLYYKPDPSTLEEAEEDERMMLSGSSNSSSTISSSTSKQRQNTQKLWKRVPNTGGSLQEAVMHLRPFLEVVRYFVTDPYDKWTELPWSPSAVLVAAHKKNGTTTMTTSKSKQPKISTTTKEGHQKSKQKLERITKIVTTLMRSSDWGPDVPVHWAAHPPLNHYPRSVVTNETMTELVLGVANLLCELFVVEDTYDNNNKGTNKGRPPVIKFTKLEDVDKLPDILFAYSSLSSAMMIDTTKIKSSSGNGNGTGKGNTTTKSCGVAISTAVNAMKHDGNSASARLETKKQSSDRTLITEEQSIQEDHDGIVGQIPRKKKFSKINTSATSSLSSHNQQEEARKNDNVNESITEKQTVALRVTAKQPGRKNYRIIDLTSPSPKKK